jgi:hypothetical protein
MNALPASLHRLGAATNRLRFAATWLLGEDWQMHAEQPATVPTATTGFTILRPRRGPSDNEVNQALALCQGRIALFHHVLRNPCSGCARPTVIIEA